MIKPSHLVIYLLMVLSFFSCKTHKQISKEAFSLVSSLLEPFHVMEGIGSAETSMLNENQLNELTHSIGMDNSLNATNDSIRIGNNFTNGFTSSLKLNLKTSDNKEWVLLLQNSNPDIITSQWKDAYNLIDRYSGLEHSNLGYVYLKIEGFTNTSLNATFKSINSIVNIGIELPFKISGMQDTLTEQQKLIYLNSLDKLKSRLLCFDKALVSKEQSVYKQRMNNELTADERLYGFVQFWTEVKYNFVFSDRLITLNWDKMLLDYIPKVKAEQSNLEYYQLLQNLCAKLKDGHTEVYFPDNLPVYQPTVKLKYLEGEAYVVNVTNDLKSILPIGSKVTTVEGIEMKQYLESRIIPYISSSTDHILKEEGVRDLLTSRTNRDVRISYETPEHKKEDITLKRYLPQFNLHWAKSKSNMPLCEFKLLADGNFAYISLNTFSTADIDTEFQKYVDKISRANSLIIDLRNNGGGNSEYGYEILKYFATKPIITSTWATRDHRPAYKAWGESVYNKADTTLDEFELQTKKNYLGTSMYYGTPDTIISDKKRILKMHMVVLIGSNTASAAEDFLIALEQMHIATTIGTKTFGSTGQPLLMKLPGGGSARICTKKDSYPDGREFVGYGIKPDIEVKETFESVLNDQDLVLEAAMHYLKHIRNIDNI